MKFFLFVFLAGYAVRCDDSNYYVVQMPEKYIPPKDFKVYWNVPTTQCKSKKIYFQDLYEKFGIIQNEGDTFRGDKISILYDPGDFPALLKNSSSGEIKYRNGGVPQEGDLIRHLNTFQKVLEQSVPDQRFNGVGIIDFESWRPVLRQNFGTLTPYKDVSYEIEKKRHWWWKKQWILEEAKRRFEEAGREFMQATVALAKKMRPDAVWGYYGFPYCFNMATDKREKCADGVPQENDRTGWLWQESTALYPSVYSSYDLSVNQLVELIRGRVKEAARVSTGGPILPYFWFRYRDKGYFSESDLDAAINTMYKSNASGFIIWGSSNDVNTIDKCKNLIEYVTNVLGPAVAKYTKPNRRVDDDNNEIYTTVSKPHYATTVDPEYIWIPPVNYTQRVKEMVDKELKEEKENASKHKENNESILVDMILHKIANYCAEGCDSNGKKTTESGDGSTTSGYSKNTTESRVDLVTEDPFKVSSTIGVSSTTTSVPTTTEEDDYTYDYELNEYIDVNTTVENSGEISTTARADEIIVIDVSKELNTEDSESTTEANEDYFIIEHDDSIDISKEKSSSTESSRTTISSTEPSINKNTTSFRTTISRITDDSTIDNLTKENNTTTVKPSTVDNYTTVVSNEFDSYSTQTPNAVDNSATAKLSTVDDYTTVKGSEFDSYTTEGLTTVNSDTAKLSVVDSTTISAENSSTVESSDSSTTMVPVTEQVLVSVSRAIVSKPVACTLFYIYSITKCICLLLGTC